MKYTGTQVKYYFLCKRKFWLYSKHIELEHSSGNQNVQLGELIDSISYQREKKNLKIGDIQIDWKDSHRTIHETKKSNKMESTDVWQLKYYLYYLKNMGITDIKGQINYPKLRQTKDVELSQEDENKLDKTFEEMDETLAGKIPEKISKKNICLKCAYYEYCYV